MKFTSGGSMLGSGGLHEFLGVDPCKLVGAPSSRPADTDGIVCNYTATGNIGTAQAPFDWDARPPTKWATISTSVTFGATADAVFRFWTTHPTQTVLITGVPWATSPVAETWSRTTWTT